jgi:hypothetical protein
MTKQVRVQVLIPVWLYEALEVAAKRDLDTISGVGRRALAKGLGIRLADGQQGDNAREVGA